LSSARSWPSGWKVEIAVDLARRRARRASRGGDIADVVTGDRDVEHAARDLAWVWTICS
jgi:hypothetical protein